MNKIQEDSKATDIRMEKNCVSNTNGRITSITGTLQQIQKAKTLLKKAVLENSRIDPSNMKINFEN